MLAMLVRQAARENNGSTSPCHPSTTRNPRKTHMPYMVRTVKRHISGDSRRSKVNNAANILHLAATPRCDRYLGKNLVALGKAAVHVLLLLWRRHDVVGLPQSSSCVNQLKRVVVWRSDDAALQRQKAASKRKRVRKSIPVFILVQVKKMENPIYRTEPNKKIESFVRSRTHPHGLLDLHQKLGVRLLLVRPVRQKQGRSRTAHEGQHCARTSLGDEGACRKRVPGESSRGLL